MLTILLDHIHRHFRPLPQALRLITDGADVIFGTTELSSATAYNTASKIYGRFTIAGPKVFEIQHIGSLTAVDDGFGNGADVTFAAIAVYTEVKIWKVA